MCKSFFQVKDVELYFFQNICKKLYFLISKLNSYQNKFNILDGNFKMLLKNKIT